MPWKGHAEVTYTNLDLVEEFELGNGEKGLRASKDIVHGTVVGVFGGNVKPYPLVDGRLADPGLHRILVQLRLEGDVLYGMDTGSELHGIDYVNHSCTPNIGVSNQIILTASRDIPAGEELVTDYREWDLVLEGLHCWCSSGYCVI